MGRMKPRVRFLNDNRSKMDDLVRVLLEKESIEREDFIAP